MQAPIAEDNREIQEWHFNILCLNMSANNAAVKTSYRALHPNKNIQGMNTVAKTQMLNEAKALLLNKQKRMDFEETWTEDWILADIKKNNIVKIHSLRTAKQHNYTYGRVVSDNLAREHHWDKKLTVQTLPLQSHYDRGESAAHDSETFNVSALMFKRRLTRVYGEPERRDTSMRFSTYHAKDELVTINLMWFGSMSRGPRDPPEQGPLKETENPVETERTNATAAEVNPPVPPPELPTRQSFKATSARMAREEARAKKSSF